MSTTPAPFTVDVRALIGKPGAYQRVSLTEAADEGINTDLVRVPPGTGIAVELMLESVSEGILVTGSAVTEASSLCSRCLDPVTLTLTAGLEELFAWSKAEAIVDEDGQPGPYVVDATVDLSQLVHDELILEMPLAPLCDDDCPGLCATCGARLIDDPDHHHDVTDPRWAALEQVKTALLGSQQADEEK